MTKTGLEFGISVIVICPSTWLRVVSPSTLLRTVSLSNGLSNHLIFDICDLEFLFRHFSVPQNSSQSLPAKPFNMEDTRDCSRRCHYAICIG